MAGHREEEGGVSNGEHSSHHKRDNTVPLTYSSGALTQRNVRSTLLKVLSHFDTPRGIAATSAGESRLQLRQYKTYSN